MFRATEGRWGSREVEITDVIRYFLGKDARPIFDCSHMFQHAIPTSLGLDVIIVLISKPGLINPEDQKIWSLVNNAAYEYSIQRNYDRWCRQMWNDMQREVSWLLSYATQSAKTLVIPDSGDVQKLGAGMVKYLAHQLQRPRRSLVQPEMTNKVPTHLRRSGQLSHVCPTDRGCATEVMPPDEIEDGLAEDHMSAIAQQLDKSGHILLANPGPQMIYCSL